MNPFTRHRGLILIAAVALSSPCFAAAACDTALVDGARYHLPGVMEMVAQDVDDDGRPDLVAATYDSSELTVLANRADGFFRAAPIALGESVIRLHEADVDGDGTEEIIVVGFTTVSTLFANLDGTYRVVASSGVFLSNVSAIGDLTNDGKVDLAGFGNSGTLRVYAGSSDGTFALIGSSPAPISTHSLYSIAAAELTGDTKGDLVILGDFGTAIFPGNGDGTFGAQRLLLPRGYLQVITGDFDGDARADILVRLKPGVGRFFSSTNGHATSTALTCAGTAQTVDLDGDGKLDTVSDVLEICRGNGNGTFDRRWNGASYFVDEVSVNHTVSVADFDGDGKLDVAGATADEDIAIFHGKGDLQLSGSQDYPLPQFGSSYVETGDVNNDGRDDIITSGDGGLGIFAAKPDGTFTPNPLYPGTPLGPMRAADLNGDTKLDLFLGYGTLLGQGDGTFQYVNLPNEDQFGALAATDLNGDQKPDFVGATEEFRGPAKVVVWLSNGTGTWSESSYSTAPFRLRNLSADDVTGDSIPDVLILGQDETKQEQFLTLRMLRGQAGGTLGPPVVLHDRVASDDVLAARFDGDAVADLVFVANTAAGNVLLVLRGTGNGSFTEHQRIPLPADSRYAATRLAAGDFDGDGRRDIAVIIPDYPVTWVFLQNVHSMFALRWTFQHVLDGGPAVAGDFNNDGVDDLAVLTSFTSMDVHLSACADLLPAVPPRVELFGAPRSSKGYPVTFTALLDVPDAHGSVAFYNQAISGSVLLGTAPVTDGHASLTVSFPDLGQRRIHAIYMGEGRYARAGSEVLIHDVTAPSSLPRRRSAR